MKTKVLLLQNTLMHYRVPCWNILADKYDFTVGFFDKDQTIDGACKFKKIKFDVIHFGPFEIVKKVRKIAKAYDVVIFMDDLHVPSYSLIPVLPHNYKVLTWGIGFRVSYTRPYLTHRKHTFLDNVCEFILNKCDAIIFYMEKAKEFWGDSRIDMKKVFVAPNTTEVVSISFDNHLKNNCLFVGSLYKGKGVDLLIKSFAEAKKEVNSTAKLIIVGAGQMRDELETMVNRVGLTNDVVFAGPIYDENKLSKYFESALVCISPLQGGLSCPKSMGYGVPFITRKDAITGGEIYHMTPGVNGIMYEKDSDLTEIIKDVMKTPDKYIAMGEAAKQYYDEYATPQHMAQGVIDAISFCFK